MDREQDLIRSFAQMDDAALRAGLEKVADTMGIAPALAQRYLADTEKIRETIAGLTAEDLMKIRDSLGEDNMNRILDSIQGDG